MLALNIQPVELFADADTMEPNNSETDLVMALESIQALLTGRSRRETKFILKMTQEFLNVVDRKH